MIKLLSLILLGVMMSGCATGIGAAWSQALQGMSNGVTHNQQQTYKCTPVFGTFNQQYECK